MGSRPAPAGPDDRRHTSRSSSAAVAATKHPSHRPSGTLAVSRRGRRQPSPASSSARPAPLLSLNPCAAGHELLPSIAETTLDTRAPTGPPSPHDTPLRSSTVDGDVGAPREPRRPGRRGWRAGVGGSGGQEDGIETRLKDDKPSVDPPDPSDTTSSTRPPPAKEMRKQRTTGSRKEVARPTAAATVFVVEGSANVLTRHVGVYPVCLIYAAPSLACLLLSKPVF